MTIEEAEEIYMAWQVGMLREEDKGQVATAILILKNNESQNESN
jgi:hypothetical protein